MTSKKEIRAICRKNLIKIVEKAEKSSLLKRDLLYVLEGYHHIALFASMESEINTFPLIEELLKTDKKVYLPKVEGDDINFYHINSLDELIEVSGIREPKGGNPVDPKLLDIVICPGLAFDKSGNRLGHGKGYYDRYLVKTSAYKVGVCYKEQLFTEIPVDKHDIKMNVVLSY